MKPERMFHVRTFGRLDADPLRSSGRTTQGEERNVRGSCAAAYVARLALFGSVLLTNLRHSGICYPKLTYRRIRHPRRRCPREAAWKQSSRNYRLAKRSNASWCTTTPHARGAQTRGNLFTLPQHPLPTAVQHGRRPTAAALRDDQLSDALRACRAKLSAARRAHRGAIPPHERGARVRVPALAAHARHPAGAGGPRS